MSLQDPISDLLTRMRNAIMAKHKEVCVFNSKFNREILNKLQHYGFINSFKVVSPEAVEGKKPSTIQAIIVQFKTLANGMPALSKLSQVSKPGLRKYVKSSEIPSVENGLGIAVISTPKGVMSCNEAREAGLGGELICFAST